MITNHVFAPIDTSDITPLEKFLEKARFYIGDDDFTPGGKYAIYTMVQNDEIVGLLEIRLALTERLHGTTPAALVTKFALVGDDENDVMTLLIHLSQEAKTLGLAAIYLRGEELPFEVEFGFKVCAPDGIYLAEGAEEAIKDLRVLPLTDEKKPGMVVLL